jgi:hypothetical protein
VIIFLDLEESEDPEIFGDVSQLPVIKVKNLESCVCGTNVGTTPIPVGVKVINISSQL